MEPLGSERHGREGRTPERAGGASQFTYDGLSRMVKIVEKTGATINSTRKFVWSGQEKVEFRDAADAVTMRIFPQGQHNGTTPYFFTRDHLGSVREY